MLKLVKIKMLDLPLECLQLQGLLLIIQLYFDQPNKHVGQYNCVGVRFEYFFITDF